jgi:PKD repeat protein
VSRYRNETFFKIKHEDKDWYRITDMFFAPYNDTQALYVITRGGDEAVIRIRYTGMENNAPPEPRLEILNEKSVYMVGDVVEFDGRSSSDPDGDILMYLWDFGDNQTSTIQQPSHNYSSSGQYTVTLTVTDPMGLSQQDTVFLMIGQPPKARIISPSDGEEFFTGQVLTVIGEAVDNTGNAIPDDQLVWEVRQHHAEHWHPFLDGTAGNNFEIPAAPSPEDFVASTNSYLEIILTATDSDGLSTQINLIIQPIKLLIEIETNPQGLEVVVDLYPVTAPDQIVSWKGHSLLVSAQDEPPYQFRSWWDGNTNRERKLKLSDENPVILAEYCSQDNWYCVSDEECCSGSCTANSCDMTRAAQQEEEANTPVPPDVDSVNYSTADAKDVNDSSVYHNNSDAATVVVSSGNNNNNNNNNHDEENDNKEVSGLSTTALILIILGSLFVVASPFMIMLNRTKRNQLLINHSKTTTTTAAVAGVGVDGDEVIKKKNLSVTAAGSIDDIDTKEESGSSDGSATINV